MKHIHRSAVAPRTSPLSQSRLALLTGGAMLASIGFSGLGLGTAQAQSDDSKKYKIGAAVLGGAAVYYGIKKKNPIAAAAAAAGAYYAYKKGKDAKRDNGRFGYDPNNTSDQYPDDAGYDNGGGYAAYPDDNGGYDDGGYAAYPDDNGYDNGGGYASYPGDDYGYESRRRTNGGVLGDVAGAVLGGGVLGDVAGSVLGGGGVLGGSQYPDYGLNGLKARRAAQVKAAQLKARRNK